MKKQLEDSLSTADKRIEAENKTEQLSKQVDELQIKLKAESDTVAKLRKAQQQLNKASVK